MLAFLQMEAGTDFGGQAGNEFWLEYVDLCGAEALVNASTKKRNL